ncbi:alpha/beta fold hydrolase [Natrialbaceae archaeon A-CW3]
MATIQCNGADLYYEEHGSGHPIVFLHGAWAGCRYFESQLTSLSTEYRTVAFDFRGHGRSDPIGTGHTIAQYARDLRAVLEHRSLDDVVLVGWSLGAIVSWEYVDQFGTDRVSGLVDVDMEPCPAERDDYEYGSYSVDGLKTLNRRIQSDQEQVIEETIDLLLKDDPPRERRTMMYDEMSRTPPSIKSAMLLELLCDYREVLPDIDVPTLVCAGADETWRSVPAVEYAAELIPDARAEVFAESGHCLTIEEPERFNRVVSDFVDDRCYRRH